MDYDIKKLHKECFIADLHCDTVGKILDGFDIRKENEEMQIDLPKLQEGGVNLQVFASWLNPKYAPNHCARRALRLIETILAMIDKNREFVQIKNSKQCKKLKKGKIGVMLAIEGGDAIEGSLEVLSIYSRLGVKMMTLTWNESNRIGDAALDLLKPHNGLSKFGKDVVKEMERLKMIIDISHASERTFWDVYENTTLPFIASHAGVYSVREHKRNLNDNQIKAIAEREGVIGVFFLPKYISKKRSVTVEYVADHIDRVKEIGGIGTIAIGSDFDGMTKRTRNLEHAGKLVNLTKELKKRGYKKSEVKKILGGNFLRVLSKFD
jgi:membrane dipeptidase